MADYKIKWNGLVDDSESDSLVSADNNEVPTSVDIVWGDNSYTWGDVAFVFSIFDGIGSSSRRAREKRLQDLDKEKKKRLIHLICRVKGEKVYDEKKEVGDIQIKLEDAELVIKEILGKMRVENTNVL
jgi:hypothetical protein